MSRPRTKYDKPEALDTLFHHVDMLAAQNGDPLLAAFECCERLTDSQAEEMYRLVWSEGAPLRGGGTGFSPVEADLIQLLAARLQVALTWEHVAITRDGLKMGEGRYVEASYAD